MKLLKDLLKHLDIAQIWGNTNIQISGIQSDSRKINPNDCFIAIGGYKLNGLDYLPEAIKRGAHSVLTEFPIQEKFKNIAWIQVRNIRKAVSRISAEFFNNPSQKLYVIGVTGTNGKTTVVSLINGILNTRENTAWLGTLGMEFQPQSDSPKYFKKTSLTTPEALDIFNFFSEVERRGCKNIVMEVSSVALKLDRVSDICFSQAVFTTFSGDHLDFHKTMQDYFLSKQKLFEKLSSEGWAVLNADDEYSFHRIIENLNCKYLTYGFSQTADVYPLKYEFSLDGIQARIRTPKGNIEIKSQLIGRVNLLNVLAAISSAVIKDISLEDIVRAIKVFKPIRGRLDFIHRNDFSVLIDYAHTDKALENLLQSLREIVSGRIILVFGAGGSRDKSKRPRMGYVASKFADWVIVTSDNPRDEEPQAIARNIIDGFDSGFKNYWVVLNREKAIQKAIQVMRNDDILVIAGKGHEDYQIFKDRTIHFDDYEVVQKILEKKYSKRISQQPENCSGKNLKGGPSA